MASRRAFARRVFPHPGRLAAYIILLVIAAAAFVAYMTMRHHNDQDGPIEISLPAPEPAELSRYLAEQHAAAAADPKVFEGQGAQGSATTDAAQLSDCTGQWLGTRKTLDDLFGESATSAPAFVGVRKSAVPGPGPSVQLMFKTDAGAGPEGFASLFLKKYMDAPVQQPGDAQSLKGAGTDMVLWRSGGLVFDIVGPPAAVESLRKALTAPTPSHSYTGK
jgi:hypothetical protein